MTFAVPRLLSEKTIKLIRQRLEANRTYLHGDPKYNYLLGGRIFCAQCGFTMTGQAKTDGKQTWLYYRHAMSDGGRQCTIRPRPLVRADSIESAVVRDLFNLFGNSAAIERAVNGAAPDCDKTLAKRNRLQGELDKVEKARNRILGMIEKDVITDSQAESELRKLKEREAGLMDQLDKVASLLADVPDLETVKRAALHLVEVCGSITLEDDEGNTYAGGNDVQSFLAMGVDDRRKLIETALNGNLPDGRPAGVYVTVADGPQFRPKQFSYVLRGRLLGDGKGVGRRAWP